MTYPTASAIEIISEAMKDVVLPTHDLDTARWLLAKAAVLALGIEQVDPTNTDLRFRIRALEPS